LGRAHNGFVDIPKRIFDWFTLESSTELPARVSQPLYAGAHAGHFLATAEGVWLTERVLIRGRPERLPLVRPLRDEFVNGRAQ